MPTDSTSSSRPPVSRRRDLTGIIESLRHSEISRGSSRPMHEQLQQVIASGVASGALQPDDLLPGELKLCEIFGVSRTVVRQALGQLEHDETVTRTKGRGTFIARPKREESLASRLTGLHEEESARGLRVTSEVLRHETVPAPPPAQEALSLSPDELVVLIERLRRVDGELWSLTTSYLPLRIGELIEHVDLETGSLYAALEARDVRAVGGSRTVEAVMTDAREGSLLGIGAGRPGLRLTSTIIDEHGDPIEHFWALHRGDRSRFVFDLDPRSLNGHILHHQD